MFINNWKKEVCTIPNLLSLFRLALIPVYMSVYLRADETADFYLAGGILAVSCLTDLADGFIARTFDMISKVGKWLDPLADKATQLALMVCLSVRYAVLRPVLCLFIIKESVQLFASLYHLHRGKMLSGALTAGKVCTAVLFISLTALVLFPRLPADAAALVAAIDFSFLLYAFLCYLLAFFSKEQDSRWENTA